MYTAAAKKNQLLEGKILFPFKVPSLIIFALNKGVRMTVTLYVQPKPPSPTVTFTPAPRYQLPSWCNENPSLDPEELEYLQESWELLIQGNSEIYQARMLTSKKIAQDTELSELFGFEKTTANTKTVEPKKETVHPTPSKSSVASHLKIPPLTLPSSAQKSPFNPPLLGTPTASADRFKPRPAKPAYKVINSMPFVVQAVAKEAGLNRFPVANRSPNPKLEIPHIIELVVTSAVPLSQNGTMNCNLTVSYLNGFYLDYSQWNKIFTAIPGAIFKILGNDATYKTQVAWQSAINLFLLHVLPLVTPPPQMFVDKPVFPTFAPTPVEHLFTLPITTQNTTVKQDGVTNQSTDKGCCTIM